MKLGIACAFRHRPEEDGHAIPASSVVQREDQEEYARNANPDRPAIMPIIGYMGYTRDGSRMLWSFVKYEAPQQWHSSYGFSSRGANLATTNVGNLQCDNCGFSGPYPTKGDRMRCPYCGRGGVHVSPIKVPSEEFDAMLGDLRDPIEQAAKNAYSDAGAPSFRFPSVLLGGSEVDPSPAVPPEIQGAAQSMGYGLKPLEEVDSLKVLQEMDPGRSFLSIVPGVSAGTMEDAEAAAGKSWQRGILNSWVKLFVPKDPPKWNFQSVRF